MSADGAGRSISEEIEQRIEQSFLIQVQVEKIFGDVKRYAKIAAVMEAMNKAQDRNEFEIKTEDERECLKALAGAEVSEKYAAFYCGNDYRREVVLRKIAKDIAEEAVMSTDPWYAMWHKDPEIGTDDDIGKAGVEVRQEPAIEFVVTDADQPTRRKRTKTA